MDINRNNYESWFMDYLEGNLSPAQEEMLMSFLEFNPDLAEELEDIDSIELKPDTNQFEVKSALRKPSEHTTAEQIVEDFEGYSIASVEKQLSANEEVLLKEILDSDPGMQKEFMLYTSTILQPDPEIVYVKKTRLKKGLVLGMRPAVFAAAASVAAMLIISLSLFTGRNNEALLSNQSNEVSERIEEQSQVRQEDLPADIQNNPENESGTAGNPVPDSPAQEKRQIPDRESFTAPVISESKIPEDSGPDRDQPYKIFPERETVLLAKMSPLEASQISFKGATVPGPTAYRLRSEGYEYVRHELIAGRIQEEKPEKRFSLWRLADASISGISSIAEDDYSLDRDLDNSGRTRRIKFETPIFGISAPTRLSENPK